MKKKLKISALKKTYYNFVVGFLNNRKVKRFGKLDINYGMKPKWKICRNYFTKKVDQGRWIFY